MKHPDNPRRAKNNSAPALTDEYNEQVSKNNKRGPTKRSKYDDINNIKRLILETV